jgi:hypothetical protein
LDAVEFGGGDDLLGRLDDLAHRLIVAEGVSRVVERVTRRA